jgi:hypothetical protein
MPASIGCHRVFPPVPCAAPVFAAGQPERGLSPMPGRGSARST